MLLDLKGNRYLGITGNDDVMLSQVAQDWPAFPKGQTTEAHREYSVAESQRRAETCVTSGLLVKLCMARDPLPSIPVLLNQELVSIGDELRPRVRIHAGHVANFILACIRATLSLRRQDLLCIAQRVRATRNSQQPMDFDCAAVSQHVAVFRRLRTYFFDPAGRCLFHSLALLFFLQSYRVFPTWVIGVKTSPWEAHSWVQDGRYLLDANPEKVCEFTPILGI